MILDTNALSALADGDRELLALIKNYPKLALPVIVLGEYRYGIKRSKERALREHWLDQLETSSNVLAISEITARHYAQIRDELRQAGKPIPENDIWIAALAREFELEVISRDGHFKFVTNLALKSW